MLESKRFERDSYINLASQVLEAVRHPLHAREILRYAGEMNIMPEHLCGHTQHKTLNARLSEYICQRAESSRVYRTGPATYFLTDLAESGDLPDQFIKPYPGARRKKHLSAEDVLVLDKSCTPHNFAGVIPYDPLRFRTMLNDHCRFLDRAAAESDVACKQFVTYAIVLSDSKMLTYRRGKYSTVSQTLLGARSIGFGGHVASIDFDLFHRDELALLKNTERELYEELRIVLENRLFDRTHIAGFINVEETADARQHIATVIVVELSPDEAPRKGELSINSLEWIDLQHFDGPLDEFELWSRILLKMIGRGEFNLFDPTKPLYRFTTC